MGVPEGRGTSYHANGEIESQGPYKGGARHGMFHYWNDQGVWVKQELYRSGRLMWESTNRSEAPPAPVEGQEQAARQSFRAKEAAARVKKSAMEVASPMSLEAFTKPTHAFISGLPGHGSFVNLTMGGGSAVQNSSATRLNVLASYADGQLGASVALNVSRFDSDLVSDWGKAVADLQASYLLPYTTGVFLARAGVVLPLGNDNTSSALASAAGVVQAPNDTIYVLPSTRAARGSISWFLSEEYLVAQFDFGIDLGLFGYSEGIHPITNTNGAVGVGSGGYVLAAEVSTVYSWTDTIESMALVGAAAYGSLFGTRLGVFAGKQEDNVVVRGSMTYEY